MIYRSKNKSDCEDAERLAKLLHLGEAPAAHVPSLDVRTWRELINCRSQVIGKRTRAKNTIRALLSGVDTKVVGAFGAVLSCPLSVASWLVGKGTQGEALH